MFSLNLPVISIYKFCRRENIIKPSGEPRRQHLGEFQQRTSKLFDMGLYFFVYQLNSDTIRYHIILFDSSVFGLRVP